MVKSKFYNLDTDATLSSNSDYYAPSEKAVKAYVDNNIPTVNNATLTIQKNGTTVNTFTANASSNVTANITVPTTAADVGALPDNTFIPTITDTYSATSTDGMSGKAVASAISTKQDIISDLATIRSGASAGATAVQPSDLSTYVTTNTAQDITERKTFFGEKAIYFKQNIASNKLGFTLYNNNDKEVGALEFRPNTIGSTPVLTLNSASPLVSTNYGNSYVGFRYWNYNLNILAPFSTSLGYSKNFFIPITFTNGTTTVESTSTDGSVNISSLLPTKTSDLTNDSGYITNAALADYSKTEDTVSAVVAGTTADKINITKNGSTSTITIDNVTNATKATQDASGNVITTTYATKSELPSVTIRTWS